MKPRTNWTISIVDRLIDDVFRRLAESPRPIYLYGHSGGGQFVHRYMMFGRAERIFRAVPQIRVGTWCRVWTRGFRPACWARRKIPQYCATILQPR